MTTLQYHQDSDTFRIINETRTAEVSHNFLYSRIVDQDLLDAALLAKQNPGDVVTVCSISKARGLKPRTAQKYFVQ